MAKKEFKERIFDGRKNEDYTDKFKQYINNIYIPKSPFPCSNLRVLPEAIKLINTNSPSDTFEKGTLICNYNVQVGLLSRCGINSKLKLDRNRNLVFKCLKNRKIRRFNVVLIDFKEK